MAFKGYSRGVLDKLNSWHLPQRIVDQFKRSLTPLVDAHPSQLHYGPDGLIFAVTVEDPDEEGHFYRFNLTITRERDEDFWAADINAYHMDDGGGIRWSSEDPIR